MWSKCATDWTVTCRHCLSVDWPTLYKWVSSNGRGFVNDEMGKILEQATALFKVLFLFKNCAKKTEVNDEKPQNSCVLSYSCVLFWYRGSPF
jgi:hypothetical protein